MPEIIVIEIMYQNVWEKSIGLQKISDQYDVIKIENIFLKILLADLDNQYLKLTGLMREFQNMFTFCILTSVTSSMTSQSFWVAFYIRSILMTSYSGLPNESTGTHPKTCPKMQASTLIRVIL